MSTEPRTQYDEDEDKFVEATQHLLDNYGVNLSDLIEILKDRTDDLDDAT
jgi:hypothetical protein